MSKQLKISSFLATAAMAILAAATAIHAPELDGHSVADASPSQSRIAASQAFAGS